MNQALFVLYEMLLVLLGGLICLAIVWGLRRHDDAKNRRITVLEWQLENAKAEISRLDAELAKTPMPVKEPATPFTPSVSVPKETIARKPRTRPAPTLAPEMMNPVPLQKIEQQLAETGRAAARFDGQKGEWTV